MQAISRQLQNRIASSQVSGAAQVLRKEVAYGVKDVALVQLEYTFSPFHSY